MFSKDTSAEHMATAYILKMIAIHRLQGYQWKVTKSSLVPLSKWALVTVKSLEGDTQFLSHLDSFLCSFEESQGNSELVGYWNVCLSASLVGCGNYRSIFYIKEVFSSIIKATHDYYRKFINITLEIKITPSHTQQSCHPKTITIGIWTFFPRVKILFSIIRWFW